MPTIQRIGFRLSPAVSVARAAFAAGRVYGRAKRIFVTTPLQITFRGMPTSAAVEERVTAHIHRLERKGKIERAHVVVEASRPGRPSATTFTAHVHLHMAGREIVASRDFDPDHNHHSVWIAIRDAMNAAERQLEDLHSQRVHDRRHAAPFARVAGGDSLPD